LSPHKGYTPGDELAPSLSVSSQTSAYLESSRIGARQFWDRRHEPDQ